MRIYTVCHKDLSVNSDYIERAFNIIKNRIGEFCFWKDNVLVYEIPKTKKELLEILDNFINEVSDDLKNPRSNKELIIYNAGSFSAHYYPTETHLYIYVLDHYVMSVRVTNQKLRKEN